MTEDGKNILALSSFPHLKRLSWIGLSSLNDIKAVSAVLERTSHQLEELNLDLINHRNLQALREIADEESDAVFARDILEVDTGRIQKFSGLRALSLSAVSFLATGVNTSDTSDYLDIFPQRAQTADSILSIFDFSLLRSLNLRSCPGWEELLELLTKSPRLLRLTSLELQSAIQDEFHHGLVIEAFIESLEGLEELFLYTHLNSTTLDIWRSVLHHKATLKRFVHHHQSLNTDDESPMSQQESDVPDLSLLLKDVAGFYNDPSLNPLGGLELKSVGLCCTPEFMVSRRDSEEITALTRFTLTEANCLCLCGHGNASSLAYEAVWV